MCPPWRSNFSTNKAPQTTQHLNEAWPRTCSCGCLGAEEGMVAREQAASALPCPAHPTLAVCGRHRGIIECFYEKGSHWARQGRKPASWDGKWNSQETSSALTSLIPQTQGIYQPGSSTVAPGLLRSDANTLDPLLALFFPSLTWSKFSHVYAKVNFVSGHMPFPLQTSSQLSSHTLRSWTQEA